MKIGELVAMLRVDRSKFDSDVDGAESKFRGLGSKLGAAGKAIGVAAGAATGVALASGIATNLEMGAAQAKMKAQLGGTTEESQRLGGVAGRLYADAYGESLGEVNQAVRSVVQTIQGMGDASEGEIQGITAQVMSLSSAFDQDLGQTTRAVDKMLRTGLAGSAEEALDILAKGFQNGNDQAGDLLDTFNEYSTMFRELGLDGQTSMGLISQGLAAGARDADKVADAIKEFGIRGRDGSKATAEGFAAIGLNADSMAKRIAAGGTEASDALGITLDHLRNMEDPVARDAAAVQLFGTQAEDLGDALYALDPQAAVAALGDVAGASQRTDQALQETAGKSIESVRRGFQMFAAELVTLPGPMGTAAAGIAALGPGALSVLGPLGAMVAAQRAAAAASVAAGTKTRGSWIRTAASATANAVKSAGAWTIARGAQAGAAVAGMAVSAGQFIAHWVRIAASSTANAARAAGAWLVVKGTAAASAVASMAVSAGQFIAHWARIAAVSTMHALRAAGAWLLIAGTQAATALASMAATAAQMVARWAMMAAGAMARAAIMAAAWVVAMGPVGWVIAAVVGLVALIIANWDTVKSWTISAWNAVTSFISNAWSNIVNTVRTWITNAVNFVKDGWARAVSNTKLAWAQFVLAITLAIARALNWVRGIPGRVLSALSNLGSLLLGSGRALVDGFLSGIKNAWGKVVSWVKDGIAKVRALFPFSPAKEGPFSGRGYVTHSGKAIATDFASSLRGGMPNIISSARDIVDAARGEFAGGVDLSAAARVSGGLPGDAWFAPGDDPRQGPANGGPAGYSGPSADEVRSAVREGIRDGLAGARLGVDARGFARVVNKQNAHDRRLGGSRVPTTTNGR